MKHAQAVKVGDVVYGSMKEAAEAHGINHQTVAYRAHHGVKSKNPSAKWDIHGGVQNKKHVRTKNIRVVYRGMMYDSYTHASECTGWSIFSIRRHIIEGVVRNSYLLDSTNWRRVDPETGEYISK